MRGLLIGTFLLTTSPAWAQQLEITPLVSYTSPAAIHQKAVGVDALTIDRSLTWGAQVGYFVSTHVVLEALWTHQSTKLSMSTSAGTPELFALRTEQAYGTVAYQFGGIDGNIRPFVFGGAGATSFRSDGLDGETKFSWTAGGGLKYFVSRRVGVEVRGGYKPTDLNDATAAVCNPFGFCQDWLNRFEVASGAIIRF